MNPGNELDALVAEHVMGDKVKKLEEPDGFNGDLYKLNNPDNIYRCGLTGAELNTGGEQRIPQYSTKIEYAWWVVDKATKDGFQVDISSDVDGICVIISQPPDFLHQRRIHSEDRVKESTIAYEICLAALKAYGYEEQ